MPSDSSDSDSDTQVPVVKKQRSTKSVHSLLTLAKKENLAAGKRSPSAEEFRSDVYTGCVARSFEAMKHGALAERLKQATAEEECKSTKPSRGALRLKGRSASSGEASVSTRKNPTLNHDGGVLDELDSLLPWELKSSQESNGDDLPLTPTDSSVIEDLTPPTPPPETPPSDRALRKTQRKRKATNSALLTLEGAHARYHQAKHEDDDVSIIDVTSPSPSRSLTIKVQSRSGIQRFTLQPGDSLAEVYAAMATHEAVDEERVAIFFKDQRVQLYDTPTRLGLTVADILECHVLAPGDVRRATCGDQYETDPEIIKLHVQGRNSSDDFYIKQTEPMEKLMREFSRHKSVPFGSLRFQFDGDPIAVSDTPEGLDLEDGFTLDVIGL